MPDPTAETQPVQPPAPDPAPAAPPDGGTPDASAPDSGNAADAGDETPGAPDVDQGDPDTETESPLVGKAITVAELLIEKKYQEVKARIAEKKAKGEKVSYTPEEAELILLQGYLTEGVPLTPGGTWPVDELQATDLDDKSVTVTGITEQDKDSDSGRMIFTYVGKDEAGNQVTGKVEGGALASARLVKHIDTIETHFDGNARQLVQWLSKGANEADLSMTEDELDALNPDTDASDSDADSDAEVIELPDGEKGDRNIGVALILLQRKLGRLPAESVEEKANLEDAILRLEAAQNVTGIEGTFAQQIAVEHTLKQLGEAAPKSLKTAKSQFEASFEQRKTDFLARFEGKIPDADMSKLKEFLGKKGDITEKILQLMSDNPSEAWIKSLRENAEFVDVLKNSTDETAYNVFIDQLMDTFPPNVRGEWRKLKGALKYGSIGIGSILALALLAGMGSLGALSRLSDQRAG